MSTENQNDSEIVTENEEPAQNNVQVPMIDYTVFDVSGRVARKGKCPQNLVEHQAFNEGETVMEGDHEDMLDSDPGHTKHTSIRQANYPTIGDQLDVLWKIVAAVPAMQTPEAVAMLKRIQAAKDMAPKGKLFSLETGHEIQVPNKE